MKKRTFKLVTMKYGVDEGDLVSYPRCEFIHESFEKCFYSRLKYTNKEVDEENETILYIPYIEYDNQIFLYKQRPDCDITEDNIDIAIMMGLVYIPNDKLLMNIKQWLVDYERFHEQQRRDIQWLFESKKRELVRLSYEQQQRILANIFTEEFLKKMRYIENNRKKSKKKIKVGGSMSKITKGNIKIATERYDDINGDIANVHSCLFLQAQLNKYVYSKIKYTKNNVILYIPYVKCNNQIYLYKQKPDCDITKDNIDIAIMADLIYIPSKDIIQTIKNWELMYGDKSKIKYIV